MTIRRVEDVAPQLRSLLALGSSSGLSDGQLLARFASGEEGASGPAFEALVERHGPMVLRVCRGVLRDPHDAEDAFQATFLVLVRRAGSIRDRDSLASWLHGVALRVANHARAVEARRRRLERSAIEAAGSPSKDEATDDLGPRLHEEVGRLPERYRAAVVLCYLEGHTCEDAARVLRRPVGTVKSRLSRARERLRGRLTRLGLAPAGVLEGSLIPRNFAPLPPSLTRATAEAASLFAAKSPAPASALGASHLAEGVLRMMSLAKWKIPGFALLAAALGLGVASALPPSQDSKAEARKDAEPKPQAPAPDPVALTVPRQLAATAGRGTALVYALDARGDRMTPEDPAMVAAASTLKVGKRREALKKVEVALEAGDPGALERAFAEARALVAEAKAPPANGPWVQEELDLRWVAITGVVDNRAIREAMAAARKGGPAEMVGQVEKVAPAETFPNYKRLDVQRQVRSPEGDWSDWTTIDRQKGYDVLDNLPEVSPERMPAEFRPPALVDPLPVLRNAAWVGVDPEPMSKLPSLASDWHSSKEGRVLYGSPSLAVRSLNFAVEPGKIYRYRVRVVLVNPDAAKVRKQEFLGPWSEPTQEVKVP